MSRKAHGCAILCRPRLELGVMGDFCGPFLGQAYAAPLDVGGRLWTGFRRRPGQACGFGRELAGGQDRVAAVFSTRACIQRPRVSSGRPLRSLHPRLARFLGRWYTAGSRPRLPQRNSSAGQPGDAVRWTLRRRQGPCRRVRLRRERDEREAVREAAAPRSFRLRDRWVCRSESLVVPLVSVEHRPGILVRASRCLSCLGCRDAQAEEVVRES